MTNPRPERDTTPTGHDPAAFGARFLPLTAPVHHVILTSPPGPAKSTLGTYLKAVGARILAGPGHADGPEQLSPAEREAVDPEKLLSALRKTVGAAIGKSLTDDQLLMLVAQLPKRLTDKIRTGGLLDTEVNAEISQYLQQAKGGARG